MLLKWYYDENRMFPIEAISKQTSSLYEKKNAVYFPHTDVQVFKISQVMTSYTQPNFDEI